MKQKHDSNDNILSKKELPINLWLCDLYYNILHCCTDLPVNANIQWIQNHIDFNFNFDWLALFLLPFWSLLIYFPELT